MSDVPLSRTTLRTAQPAAAQSKRRPLARAKPLAEESDATSKSVVEGDTIVISAADTGIHKSADVGPVVIHIDTSQSTSSVIPMWGGLHTGAGALAFVLQFVVHEAPAWAVSMVIHMVTLVTMTMVAVPEPTPYKATQLTVTPTKEEKVEEIKEVNSDQPTSLDESTSLEAVAFESKLDQDSNLDIQPSDEPEVAPAAVDLSDYGLEHVPKSDLLTMVGVYGGMGLSARGTTTKAQLVLREGGSDSSEKAVATALRWLANHQLHDGGWSFNHTLAATCRGQCRNPGSGADARNGATGLALLPFLGGGQTHMEGKYRATIRRGLAYLVNHMRVGAQGGALNEASPGSMYSHGLASIALCEAYAMTHDKELQAPAQEAMNFICFAQDPTGGGWRYKPKQPGDTSIVGWQLMALKSGHMANLKVPPLTIHRASLYLDSVQSDDGAAYSYQGNKSPGEATTAIGLLCRMYLGWKRDNPALQRGVKFLSRHGPSGANMYYNYYATQVMRHWEGEEWLNWNRQMRDQLVHAQAKQGHEDGSWFSGTGDTGAGAGGRLYCTAMATMILEVYYRHLPLYRAQSVDQDFPE
jgi:hypothetical protein